MMAAEGCIAWGIGSSVATARVMSVGIPFRAAWDQVIGHGLLRGESTPVGPFGGFLKSGFSQPKAGSQRPLKPGETGVWQGTKQL